MISTFRLLLALICLTGLASAAETETRYLSGHGKDDGVPWDFLCTGGRSSGEWTKILVPSCWELQGFGAYGYQSDPVKEQGKYRTHFAVPEEWTGKAIRIVFEGSMTDTEVWVNGQSAGPLHQGAFYRFKHDITKLVKVGRDNLLEVTVAKYSANDSVNAAERRGDYWNFGGIIRPVYLEALPMEFVERTAIDARADGSFSMEVFLGGGAKAVDQVTAQIEGLGESVSVSVSPGASKVLVTAKFNGQKNWTAETPHRYSVTAALSAKGQPVHTVKERFGFRTVEVREGDGLYVNGQRVTLKGCCRHSFWPESGRTCSEQVSRDDVKLLKEMNMNAVRMSHYPPDVHFLDACDELGLYVLDELGGWHGCYDRMVGAALVEAMVKRDVNHPCILFWDNGNEGGWNVALDGDFAKWDPQRRRVLHPWALSGGIDTAHYLPFDGEGNVGLGSPKRNATQLCSGTTLYMPTEFSHGLYDGGAGAGLDDYWELMRTSKVCTGGFIWAFLDEAVARTDKNGWLDSCANLAPDGIVGPHREKEGSFNTIREIWCPVQLRGEHLPALTVENRYDFTNLDQCRFEWALGKFSLEKAGHTVVANGAIPATNVPPHATANLRLELPANWREADVLYVTAKDPAHRELWTWSWRLNRSSDFVKAATGKVEVNDGADLKVRTGGLELTFSKNTGLLVSAGRMAFSNGPRFVASTKQRVEAGLGKDNKMKFKTEGVDLSGTSKLISLTQRMEGGNAVVEAKFEGPLSQARWTILPGGWIKLAYKYRLNHECDIAGVQFDYPEKLMKSVRWLGRGPYRVWKNRMKGTTWDVWQAAYNDTVPGESWIYPEFKGYFGDWQWAVFETTQGKITVASQQENTFIGIYRPHEGKDPKAVQLFTPPTGLAFLDAIPPTGNKFCVPEKLGPQSQPNRAPGVCERTVFLRFEE